jgi:geranylgeranyl diphosphate synthase type II
MHTASSLSMSTSRLRLPDGRSAPSASDVLEDYLAECKEACDGEINRLYGRGDRGSSPLYELILDYPLRGGKALRPALGIATCLGLGGHLEAILPTAATLELYHNAFLIHDDIEDESWWRRGQPTLHIDHGIPIAVNVGDAMLSLSLQPLLDNVERVGLGPALRILRAVAHMTRQTVEGQAIELDWVRSNTWQLDDADYLAMVELKTSWYSFITPLQVGAVSAGAGPEQLGALESLGRHLGAAFQITDDLLNLRADPEEYGKEIGGDLWEGKRTLMLLHALRSAEPGDRDRAVQILGKRRPSADRELKLTDLLDRLAARGELSSAGRDEITAEVQGYRTTESKSLDDIRWLYGLMHRVGSLEHAREVGRRHAREAAAVLSGLDWLPVSRHRDVLRGLVDYVHGRAR